MGFDAEFDAFVSARAVALTRYAYALTGDRHEAEDLVQTALMKLYRHWPKVVRADHPEAYVRRAVLNAHLNETSKLRWRREKPMADLPDRPAPRTWDDPGIGVPETDAVHDALRRLPPRQRAVLVLRHYQGMDDAAIATEMGCSEVSVRAYASKAGARMRDILTPHGSTDDTAGTEVKP